MIDCSVQELLPIQNMGKGTFVRIKDSGLEIESADLAGTVHTAVFPLYLT